MLRGGEAASACAQVEVFAKVLTAQAGLGIIVPSCEDLMTDMIVDNMIPAMLLGPQEVLVIVVITIIVMIIVLRGRGRGR